MAELVCKESRPRKLAVAGIRIVFDCIFSIWPKADILVGCMGIFISQAALYFMVNSVAAKVV
jgi:hypothetical protein